MEPTSAQSNFRATSLTTRAGRWLLRVCYQLIQAIKSSALRIQSSSTTDAHKQRKLGPETVFRLQGLPITYHDCHVDREDAKKIVREVFNVESDTNVTVHSLAKLFADQEQTATLTFSRLPLELEQRMKDQAQIDFHHLPSGLDLTLDTHFDSLTPLYSPPDSEYSLDVIALPGLGANAFWAFKSRVSGYMWLRDGLRHSMPSARVMIFGYDSQLEGSNSNQSLVDLGRKFRDALVSEISARNRDKASNGLRPIALIGQSLGGLLIKQAMFELADGSPDERMLLKAIGGIFFFGTPNSGMDIKSTIPMVEGQPNEQFLHSIGNGSQLLQVFRQKWEKYTAGSSAEVSPRLKIYSFYETIESPTALKDAHGRWRMIGKRALLVDRDSATHGRPWQADTNRFVIPMNTAHSDMVKFASKRDGVYRYNVIPGLESISKGHDSKYLDGWISFEQEELLQSCLSSLRFSGQDSGRQQITEAENNTCEWILENDTYFEWLNGPQSLLWIEGHPGVGKSTVLNHALQSYRDKLKHHVVASYFFLGTATDLLQKTPLGLYRWLLCQTIKHFPITFWDLILRCEEMESSRRQTNQWWSWRPEELKRFLKEIIPRASRRRPIAIFIDALDECAEEDREAVIDLIDAWRHSNTPQTLKICVSSRHYPVTLTGSGALRIPVERHNYLDIETFVKNELSSLQFQDYEEIANQIISKAQGLFQWADLVCKKVRRMVYKGKTKKQIRAEILKVPETLNRLYESLLLEDPGDREQTLKLFQWISSSTWPLELFELQWVLVLSPGMAEKSVSDCQKSGNVRESPEKLMAAIRDLSKGLVDFTNEDPNGSVSIRTNEARKSSHIQDGMVRRHGIIRREWRTKAHLIHQTVKDYLIEKGLSLLEGPKLQSNPIGRAHYCIARSSLHYLFLDETYTMGQTVDDFPSPIYWSFWRRFRVHLAESDKQWGDDLAIVKAFSFCSEEAIRHFRMSMEFYIGFSSSLVFASEEERLIRLDKDEEEERKIVDVLKRADRDELRSCPARSKPASI